MLVQIVVILALILANGVFAGAEIALLATRRTRIAELAEEGSVGARAALHLRARPERFIATVQVGITVVSATAAALGGATLADDLAGVLARVFGPGALANDLALALVVVAVAFLSIVVGELVPKSLALRSGERYALLMARPMSVLAWLAHPVVWLLTAVSNAVLRPFGDRTTFTETRYTADELQQLVEEAAAQGAVPAAIGEIASRALDLAELRAIDLMVPRREVVFLQSDASPEEVLRAVSDRRHSRMPVIGDGVDDVIGYVSVKDLFAAEPADGSALHRALRRAFFVPETMSALTLLHQMKTRHQPFAIVVDELGALSGIVTLEDVLEELVGEIVSEHHEPEAAPIERTDDGGALVWGSVPVRDVNRALGLHLPEDGDWTTVAGLCNALAAHIPARGERMTAPRGEVLEVVEATPRQVRRVRLVGGGGAPSAVTPPG